MTAIEKQKAKKAAETNFKLQLGVLLLDSEIQNRLYRNFKAQFVNTKLTAIEIQELFQEELGKRFL